MELLQKANGNIVRTEAEKEDMIVNAAFYYGKFLKALGFDWTADPNSEKTPYRVAKAWIEDIVSGSLLHKPTISHFPCNEYKQVVFDGNIEVVSLCSHHNLPFTGIAHVAYIPKAEDKNKIVGLSKLNRIVDWYARRPQVQEALTQQIHDEVNANITNAGVAVYLQCKHACVCNRGIKDDSAMITAALSGHFLTNELGTKDEFYNMINNVMFLKQY